MMDAPDDNVPPGPSIPSLLSHCSSLTNIPISKLAYTTYREVESDVGKNNPQTSKGGGVVGKKGDGKNAEEQVAKLAGKVGDIW